MKTPVNGTDAAFEVEALRRRVTELEETIACYEAGLTVGCRLVQKKRGKQIHKHGYSPKHDDTHSHGELARAGAILAEYAVSHTACLAWPFAERFSPDASDVENRINAAALIVADLDRELRKEAQNRKWEG